MSLSNIGKKIREERLNKGLTQEQLAEKADISLNFMSLIENGKNMSVQTLLNLCKSLDISVESLLNDSSNYKSDALIQKICLSLSTLNDDEKLYFLNMIKQYKILKQYSSI